MIVTDAVVTVLTPAGMAVAVSLVTGRTRHEMPITMELPTSRTRLSTKYTHHVAVFFARLSVSSTDRSIAVGTRLLTLTTLDRSTVRACTVCVTLGTAHKRATRRTLLATRRTNHM